MEPDRWARELAIAGLARGFWNLRVFRRKQGRLKVKVRWDARKNPDDTMLRVTVVLQAVGEPVYLDQVAVHETRTRWWDWRDRGPRLVKEPRRRNPIPNRTPVRAHLPGCHLQREVEDACRGPGAE